MAGDWKVDGGRLWAAGIATAIVAGLAAVVVWFFTERVFDVELIVTERFWGGDQVDLGVLTTFFAAFAAGIAATAVLHVLLAAVPGGTTFFVWIGVLLLFSSLIPVLALDVTRQVQAWLLGMHVAVFVAVVPTLRTVVARVAQPVVRPPL